jgi:molecular chaperone GrpE (heat shock protein)
MGEEKKTANVDDLLKQIEEFEKTIQGLASNVANLKQRLLENKEKYGPDISKWPKEAK